MNTKSHLLLIPALGALLTLQAEASLIYSDDFSGGSGDLNGTTPDTTTGATWIASPNFNANGSTQNGAGSATLAFTPVDGFIYTLDASYSGLGLTGGADTDWFALGFVNGQSTGSSNNDRFITGNVVGSAWMFTRGDTTLDPDTFAWLGTGALGGGNGGLAGGNDGGTNRNTAGNSIDMRIILDTTAGGGPAGWNATWLARGAGESSYATLRTENLAGATISAVGLARSGSGVTGTVNSFSLTAVVPEPSTALALLGLVTSAFFRRRRRVME